MSETDSQYDSAAPAPAQPDVYLVGEAGFTPVFPKVGEGVSYYWSEVNRGGPHTDVYHARVLWRNGDHTIDDKSVECTALEANGSAYRTTTLSAPTESGVGYSIELWVDIDHHAEAGEGYNYAYHAVTVDD